MLKGRGKTESGEEKGKIRKGPLQPDTLGSRNIKVLFVGCDNEKAGSLSAAMSASGHVCKSVGLKDLKRELETFMDTVVMVGPESAQDEFYQLQLIMKINREHEKAYVIAVYDNPAERVYVDTILRKNNDVVHLHEFMAMEPEELETLILSRFGQKPEETPDSAPAIKMGQSSLKVLVCGCNRWMGSLERIAGALSDEGFSFESVPKLPHVMRRIITTTEPIVVLLGPGDADSAGTYQPRAEMIVSCNRQSGNKARIIGIYSEDTKDFDFRFGNGDFADAISVDDFERMETNEWAYLLDGTYHDLMSKPAPLEKEGKSVVCEVVGGNIFDVVEGRVEKVDGTMSEFAKSYILHQRYTGHMTAMDALLNRLKPHFGNQILDIGCGTGDPMRGVVRNVMIAEYTARPRLRGPTRILSVDSNKPMLAQCEREFNGMKRGRGEELKLLNMHFLISDLMDTTPEMVQSMGLTRPDTILASYIIYWANDKLGTMRKFHDLLAPGGKLIVVEEAPLVVTPSPHMPASLIEGIKKHIRVIPLDEYYRALVEVGFVPVENGEKVYEIDDQHKMYGRVFIRA
jgi:SAM-dependent methyltransferase